MPPSLAAGDDSLLEWGSAAAMDRPHEDSLVARVVAFVRHHIADRKLKPGDRLPGEETIARALGISRPVVREASRTLSTLGLVEVAPGRAPRVGRMHGRVLRHVLEDAVITGQAQAHHVLEVRRGLEISMAALAASRRSAAMVKNLTALANAMAGKLQAQEEYVALDLEFHRTLAAATANPFYVQFIDACRAAFESSMDAGLRHRFSAAELDRVQSLHMEILDAVRRGDPEAAAEAMTRHCDDALAALYRCETDGKAGETKVGAPRSTEHKTSLSDGPVAAATGTKKPAATVSKAKAARAKLSTKA